jgi:Tol biopolymer transport system component
VPMARFTAASVSLFVVLAAASVADAQYFGRNKVRYESLDFRVIQTEHFDIYYYAEEETATRHAARMAERWYARFSHVLEHTFARRQPLVLYASHPHFSQTNVTPSSPGEGIGGLTERAKARIAMPFAAGLGATDRILGHEIAHAFQIDIARRAGQDAFALPGWLIEGMAEYLALGPDDPLTTMWVRDAVAHNRLPTIERLSDLRYSPYRYGQAFWSFLATQYGDAILGRVLRSKVRGVLPRLEAVTGAKRAELTRAWHDSLSVEESGEARLEIAPNRLGSLSSDGARLHIAPALSPDGRHLIFMSERERLSLDVFLADAQSGAVIRKIVSTAADPHFDSLQYIRSSGAWDPAGRRFAITALTAGQPVLVIVDVAGSAERVEIPLEGIGEAYNPSWAPEGDQIVFSGLKGGLSDLFVYALATGELRQLTADEFADLHPAWSPDGRQIAFATDRFTSSLPDLSFGALTVGLLDLETGVARPVRADTDGAKQVSPQWSPSGEAVYFVSDRAGISNVYRVDVSSGALHRITDVVSGVSGVTSQSPALAVASRAGSLAFSVYRDGRFEIETLDAASASAGVLVPSAGEEQVLADAGAGSGTVEGLLADARTGLPVGVDYSSKPYDDRLRLESIAPPFVGAATGAAFGGALRASFGVSLADTLRDRQLQLSARLSTDVDDLAFQVASPSRSRT